MRLAVLLRQRPRPFDWPGRVTVDPSTYFLEQVGHWLQSQQVHLAQLHLPLVQQPQHFCAWPAFAVFITGAALRKKAVAAIINIFIILI
jgi:hypothetical protein